MIPFGTPRPSPFKVVERPDRNPWGCALIPGTAGPFIDTGQGYISSTSLSSLIDAAGWPHPEEVAPLIAELDQSKAKVAELQLALSRAKTDADEVADALIVNDALGELAEAVGRVTARRAAGDVVPAESRPQRRGAKVVA